MKTYVKLVKKIGPRSIKTLVILVTKPENEGNVIHQANSCNKSDQSHHMNSGKCGNLGKYGTVSNQIGQTFLADIYLRGFFLFNSKQNIFVSTCSKTYINFHTDPSSGSEIFPCRETEEQTVKTGVVVACQNCGAKEQKMPSILGENTEYFYDCTFELTTKAIVVILSSSIYYQI